MDEHFGAYVRRAQDGEVTAFDWLVRRFQDRAVGYACALLTDPMAAEDAAQEAFVEAFQCLKTLREPNAFPVFLRRIIFKQCDRIRRVFHPPMLSLDAVGELSSGIEPLPLFLASEKEVQVRSALHSLPPPERETTLLYYLGGSSVAEIAAFLEIPRTTVKNRLHTARKRLRKELWEMAEEILPSEKPSRDDAFARRVLRELVGEFEKQRNADPHTADRSLLVKGREQLNAILDEGVQLDWDTVFSGFQLLLRQDDDEGIIRLTGQYLRQPLSDSEGTWAHYFHMNYLACANHPKETIDAQKQMDSFLAGRSPHIKEYWPFVPVPDREAGRMAADAIPYWVWCKSHEFALAYRKVGKLSEYIANVEQVFATVPPSDTNRSYRFYCLRMLCGLHESEEGQAEARKYIARMAALGDEVADPQEAEHWRMKASGHELNLYRSLNNREAARRLGAEMVVRLEAMEPIPPGWVRGERHNTTHSLAYVGAYDLALPLFEANLASGGHMNGWGYLIHAATVWGATKDRTQTLALIREAACYDNREVLPLFADTPTLGEMASDPEFVAAAQKPV